MTQSWHDLLFAHWSVDANLLRSKLPPDLPLDLFNGQAWIGVIPFHMTNVAPRGFRWCASAFSELNVRTYVTRDGRPGTYFFSLDATNALAVAGARSVFHLPYNMATMAVDVDDDSHVTYRSRRNDGRSAEFAASYQPLGSVQWAERGTLDHFLTERYCLYAVDRRRRLRRLEIHHPQWPLQPAHAHISLNTMAEANGIRLPDAPPLLHFAKRLDVVAWPLKVIE